MTEGTLLTECRTTAREMLGAHTVKITDKCISYVELIILGFQPYYHHRIAAVYIHLDAKSKKQDWVLMCIGIICCKYVQC